MHEQRRRVLLTLLGAPSFLLAQPRLSGERLPALTDLRDTATLIARYKAPLLVLFSTPGCPFCLEVRRNYLLPRVAEQARESSPTLLLSETDITSKQLIIDLSGGNMTEAAFASRFNVRAVPVVGLFDRSLRLLVEPLVGLDRSGFYEAYLSTAIEEARRRLKQNS